MSKYYIFTRAAEGYEEVNQANINIPGGKKTNYFKKIHNILSYCLSLIFFTGIEQITSMKWLTMKLYQKLTDLIFYMHIVNLPQLAVQT